MKYTKKPVTIEAVLWDGIKVSEAPIPNWLNEALNKKPGEPGSVVRMGKEVEIYTLEGKMTASPGDYIIRGIKDEIYPCKPDIFAATYSKEGEETALQKLTKFQEEVGYVEGEINTVAMLGLFGEAGEVLDETTFKYDEINDKNGFTKSVCSFYVSEAVHISKNIDTMKKQVRDHKLVLATHVENTKNFDTELADVFYYLHALAKNRGLSLEDLAAMSLKKIGDKKLQKDISNGANA